MDTFELPVEKAHGIHLLYPEACTFPINAIRVANVLGYKVYRNDEITDGMYDVDKKCIYLNTAFSAKKKNFIVAHELGHAVMHHSKEDIDKLRPELEANIFARNLLVPTGMLYYMIKKGYSDFDQLTAFFGVGDYVLAARLEDIGVISSQWRK